MTQQRSQIIWLRHPDPEKIGISHVLASKYTFLYISANKNESDNEDRKSHDLFNDTIIDLLTPPVPENWGSATPPFEWTMANYLILSYLGCSRIIDRLGRSTSGTCSTSDARESTSVNFSANLATDLDFHCKPSSRPALSHIGRRHSSAVERSTTSRLAELLWTVANSTNKSWCALQALHEANDW
jgi:hypothetical protein